MIVSRVELNPADFADYTSIHALLVDTYQFMDGRIDPPSSLTQMTVDDIREKSRVEDLYLIRQSGLPVACMFGTKAGDVYEVGKVAVAAAQRRRGLARAMIQSAAERARGLGLETLQLFARVELTENHATYRSLGFTVHGPFTHPGFTRPTAVVFRRAL